MSDVGAVQPLSAFVERVVGGGTPSRSIPAYWSGLIPWASVKDLNEFSMTLMDTEEHISAGGLANSTASLVRAGTPIVCTRMAVGRCAIPAVDVAINQDLKALVAAAGVDARYLAHGLNYLRPMLQSASIGSTVKGLSLRQLLSFPLYKPSLIEQRSIAELLDTTDEVIRSTERLIAKLEQVNKGLIRDLLTHGIDETGALRRIDRVHRVNGRKLPAGWRLCPLSEIAEVSRGQFTHRPRNDPAYYGGEYPFIQTGDVTRVSGGYISGAVQTLSELGASVSLEFPAGTIAVTIAANIGDTGILAVPMYFPDSIVGVQVHAPHNIRFVELCIRTAKPGLEHARRRVRRRIST